MRAIGSVIVMAIAAASAAPAEKRETTASVPFTIDQIFGARPVVHATINGRAYRLVVHANAGSYLQINHAEAQIVGAHNLVHRGAYGISAPGKVSDLGRDDGKVDKVVIGGWSIVSAPVAVFEVPAGGSQGMLGLPFLSATNAILDFGAQTMTLASNGPSRSLAAAMRRRGYVGHPMTRDPQDGRYLVAVTINGATAQMVVSTVATIDLDTGFAARANVAVGGVTGHFGGPSGATGQVFKTAAPISLRIGDWTSNPVTVSVEDTYAYARASRPADATQARGGALGADFMIEHTAVIDFGNATLYLKR